MVLLLITQKEYSAKRLCGQKPVVVDVYQTLENYQNYTLHSNSNPSLGTVVLDVSLCVVLL